MPKLDKQGRITIPFNLREELKWNLPQSIAICYDFSSKAIVICEKEKSSDRCIIDFRELDSKGRFSFPKEALILLNAKLDDQIVFYIRNSNIFVIKP